MLPTMAGKPRQDKARQNNKANHGRTRLNRATRLDRAEQQGWTEQDNKVGISTAKQGWAEPYRTTLLRIGNRYKRTEALKVSGWSEK